MKHNNFYIQVILKEEKGIQGNYTTIDSIFEGSSVDTTKFYSQNPAEQVIDIQYYEPVTAEEITELYNVCIASPEVQGFFIFENETDRDITNDIILDEYNPFTTTAIKRSVDSVPYRKLQELELLQPGHAILDFGCGRGEDFQRLQSKGFNVVGYDGFNPEFKDDSLLDAQYDIVVCNYVFNTIPDKAVHSEVLETLRRLGKTVYIAVRSDIKAVKENWHYVEQYDAYLTPKQSYQRFYDIQKVEEYFGKVEYIINNNSTRLFKLI